MADGILSFATLVRLTPLHMNDKIAYSIFDELSQETPFYEEPAQWQRFLNLIIDVFGFIIFIFAVMLILAIVMAIFDAVSGTHRPFRFDDKPILYLIINVLYLAYFTMFEGFTKGLTLGKLITRTKAVQTDLSPITFRQAFLRSCIRLLPFESFSIFAGELWHDKWTHTMVIKKRRRV